MFESKRLEIRKKKGEDPIHVYLLWASHDNCGDKDVLYLIEYLLSKGRDCHVNNGVHGEVKKDGTFYFRWDKASKGFYGQDY